MLFCFLQQKQSQRDLYLTPAFHSAVFFPSWYFSSRDFPRFCSKRYNACCSLTWKRKKYIYLKLFLLTFLLVFDSFCSILEHSGHLFYSSGETLALHSDLIWIPCNLFSWWCTWERWIEVSICQAKFLSILYYRVYFHLPFVPKFKKSGTLKTYKFFFEYIEVSKYI